MGGCSLQAGLYVPPPPLNEQAICCEGNEKVCSGKLVATRREGQRFMC